MAYEANQAYGGQSGGQDPYAYQRNLAQQRASGQQQSNFDALQRRFAANGGMNSGAAIQAEQNANRDTQQNLENTQGSISQQQGQNTIEQQQRQAMLGQQQAFAGQQTGLERQQQESQFGRSLGQQASQFQQELPLKQKALDLEAKQQGMDLQAMTFNEGLAQWQQSHSGGLLGAGGFLGTGFGSGGSVFGF